MVSFILGRCKSCFIIVYFILFYFISFYFILGIFFLAGSFISVGFLLKSISCEQGIPFINAVIS